MNEPPAPSWTTLVVDSINQLRTDFKGDMALLNARLDKLVSHDVHQADLRRIDGRIDDLAADLGTDRLRAHEVHTKMDGRLDTIVAALTAEATARRDADDAEAKERERVIKAERESRRQAVKWGIGTLLASATVFVSVLALILR